jgi:hypothetical protein
LSENRVKSILASHTHTHTHTHTYIYIASKLARSRVFFYLADFKYRHVFSKTPYLRTQSIFKCTSRVHIQCFLGQTLIKEVPCCVYVT